jgi:hypothetical protein
MKLRTLYCLGQWKLSAWRDKLLMAIVWRLPRRIVMWAAIRVGSHATTGQFSDQVVPELLFIDAIKRWDTGAL